MKTLQIQYQALAEPVVPDVTPEEINIDKWTGNDVMPVLRRRRPSLGYFVEPHEPNPVVPIYGWGLEENNRVVLRRKRSVITGMQAGTPVAPSYVVPNQFDWYVETNRPGKARPKRRDGMRAAPPHEPVEVAQDSGWNVATNQPIKRKPKRRDGGVFAPLEPTLFVDPVLGWLHQTSRPVLRRLFRQIPCLIPCNAPDQDSLAWIAAPPIPKRRKPRPLAPITAVEADTLQALTDFDWRFDCPIPVRRKKSVQTPAYSPTGTPTIEPVTSWIVHTVNKALMKRLPMARLSDSDEVGPIVPFFDDLLPDDRDPVNPRPNNSEAVAGG